MVAAPVGFQCPECVSQGNRDTRQNRTRFGGTKPSGPQVTTLALIGLNVLVFAFVLATGSGDSPWYPRLALSARGACAVVGQPGYYYQGVASAAACAANAGSWEPGFVNGAWWQALTSAFLHVQPIHIGMNMLALWYLGPGLERVTGRARFVALYLISALGGSAAVLWLSPGDTLTLGASGAIFGLMGALLVFVVKTRGNVSTVLTWLGINIVITFTIPNISWQGHLGGLVTGAALAAVLAYAPQRDRTSWQWTGIASIGLIVLAVLVARFFVPV